MHFVWIGEDSGPFIAFDSIILPAALEQFVYDFEELIRNPVSFVMFDGTFKTIGLCGAFEIAGYDIPPDLRHCELVFES